MAANKRKQDEKHLKILRDLVSLQHNKQCFDCQQRGPTYINMTIGSFVCTACSGILRGISPAHRVKSISMASFTPEEIDFIKCHGNEFCRQVWLGLHDARSLPQPDSREEQKVRDFMSQKYEKKRWYIAPTDAMKNEAKQMTEAMLCSKQSSANSRSLKTKLGSNSAKITITTSSQQPVVSKPVAVPALISSPTTSEAPPLKNAPFEGPKQSATLDLLGDLGGDLFGTPAPAASVPSQPGGMQPATYSNFANFNNGPAMSSTTVNAGLDVTSSTTTLLTANRPPLTHADKPPEAASSGGGDKYAALLSLDDSNTAMASPSAATGLINWSGMAGPGSSAGSAGGGGGGAAINWSSQPVKWDSPGTVSWDAPGPMSTAANAGASVSWGGSATNMFPQSTVMSAFPAPEMTGPMAAGNPFLVANNAMNPFSGVAQAQTVPSGGGNPFGGTANSSMFGGGGASFPPAAAANQGWPPSQQSMFNQQTAARFPTQNPALTQAFPAQGFGAPNSFPTQNGSSGFPAMMASQPAQFAPKGSAAAYGGSAGGWAPSAPPGNPFMNAAVMQQQQVPPRSNTTNPFL